jgi:hypothetical protein
MALKAERLALLLSLSPKQKICRYYSYPKYWQKRYCLTNKDSWYKNYEDTKRNPKESLYISGISVERNPDR